MRDNSTVQVQCITQYTLSSSPRPPPTVQRQYNIAYVRRGQTVRTVRVARCPVTTSSHNSSHRRLYGEPLRAPAGRRGRGGGEEYTLPSHRIPDVVGVTLVNTW